ncbi:MAG: tRNA (adenosine(37)-N6)-threonylcarbamoyltransferase complex transferase subunit TsaD [Spirochaetaceae bacterium]|nr:MAG: tRNA (adenosine(37)-N6)-threonylcarbamoyltransferase complex transferase subunit TsaD [Spirochaetaceae bacterium]
MNVLGIETSCDECSVAVVADGRAILAHQVATQIAEHARFQGVVPEIASRKHAEWIVPVFRETLASAGLELSHIDAIAVTNRPGLIGSLMVGVGFAKALAFGRKLPLVGVDHILAHLYAPQLEQEIAYPFLGLLVSGGHTIICRCDSPFDMHILGTTIDDACGEAFDKVAKFYDWGYPGGVVIDRLSASGDANAFSFPDPSLHKGEHRYDVSYSGLKTAVINQLDQFWNDGFEKTPQNVAASFQRAAIDMIVRRLLLAAEDSGIERVVVGGGVAANSYLRHVLLNREDLKVVFPSALLCTDNAAMIAGLGYHLIQRGDRDGWDLEVAGRVSGFRRGYP